MTGSIYRSEAGATLIHEQYREFLSRWPMLNEQHLIPTHQGDTFVVACGEKSSPPLFLFHGSMSNSIIWRRDVEVLAKNYRVYAVDIIGEPGLSAPSRPTVGSADYAAWLDEVLDYLGVESASFVGISLGGWLALDYAIRRPQRIEQLVLMCPVGVAKQKVGFYFKVLILLLFGKRGAKKLRNLVYGRDFSSSSPAMQAFMDFTTLIQKHFRPRLDRFPLFADEQFRSLSMPVLTIVGAKDVFFDARQLAERMNTLVPHVTVNYLNDCGHMIMEQTQVIADFLASNNTAET